MVKLVNRTIKLLNYFKYKIVFGKFSITTYLEKPLKIEGAKNIYIHGNTHIRKYAWLGCLPLTNEQFPILRIHEGCQIGHFNEIYATKSIIIEKNVLTADRVYISDNLHKYENIQTPVIKQPIKQINTVTIGEGSWLGIGVTVIGANIGKHCVIGANSVVTKDIPDYSVAVGIPAKIIKRYDFTMKQWRRTNSDGDFIDTTIDR